MTTFHIKVLAAVLMVIDHIGVIFFRDVLAFRFLGRLSFPLFAWLIGQGEKHTTNFNNYLVRLGIWGLLSQPIYYLVFSSFRLNILATLFLGLLAIRLDKFTNIKLLSPLCFSVLAQLLNAEYGAYGVFTITVLSEINFYSIAWWMKWTLLNLITLFLPGFLFYQVLAVLAPIILILWNGKQGRRAKWLYAFYPLHLALIIIGRLLILSS
jgi:hypothetical protein